MTVFNDTVHFATVGDDATLRIWNSSKRYQEKIYRFDIDKNGEVIRDSSNKIADCFRPKSIAISNDGNFIALGFKDGTVKIINIEAWEITHSDNCSKYMISDLKFSPNGNYLAIGSYDQSIRVLNFPEMTSKAVFKGHSSFIRNIDWAEHSRILHSDSGDNEMLFWNIESGTKVEKGAIEYRNELWSTWSCIIGWPMQGVWPINCKDVKINTCDRSFFYHDKYQLIATGNNIGHVDIFRYPSTIIGSKSIKGKGHSSSVTNVRFGNEKKHLFSTGGNDGCVFQWNIY